jgi:ribosomal protein S18 acetylase RimI-like enzyme
LAGGYQGWSSGARVGEIKDFVVTSAARGSGVGTALLAAVKARLAELGVAEYRVNVVAANQSAVAFYERCGLKLVSYVFLGETS